MKNQIRIIFVFIIFSIVSLTYASTYYVSTTGAGSKDGSSWSNAFEGLQDALDAAESGDQIWIEKGTYKPSEDNGIHLGFRGYHFHLINGVAIYGGFAGTESSVGQRSDYGPGKTNETILSGDLDGNDEFDAENGGYQNSSGDDNCYHVFFHPDTLVLTNTAILDGVTISGGNANSGSNPHNYGGGMYDRTSSPFINNCTFISNNSANGGGFWGEASDAKLTNCTFTENTSSIGAGINIYNSSTIFINCLIDNNYASNSSGGMHINTSSPTITNCTFTDNNGNYSGGLRIIVASSEPVFNNCIIWGNTADTYGDDIWVQAASVTTNYCCYGTIQVTSEGTVDSDEYQVLEDPQFVGSLNNPDHPYCIGGISACVDAGNNAYNDESYDIRGPGFPRKLNGGTGGTGGTIDMGAYEYYYGEDVPLPIVLRDFNAYYEAGSIILSWETASETENMAFRIYRDNELIAQLNGKGTTSEPNYYHYTDHHIVPGKTYAYVLADVTYSNIETRYDENTISITVPENDIPEKFALNDNYPNPFNPKTAISYQLSAVSRVDLSIYDLNGKKVTTLVNDMMPVGYHEVIWDASGFTSGIYFYCLKTDKYQKTKKMLLLK